MSLVTAAIIVGLLYPQSSTVRRADRDYDELNGPVRSVRIEYERLPEDKPKNAKSSRELEKIVVYDRGGRMTEEVDFSPYPSPCTQARRRYSYSNAGDREELLYWGETLSGQASNAVKPLAYRQAFTFDASGRWTEVEDYDPTGKLYSKTTYRYDDKSRISEIASDRSICAFKYDAAGLVSEEVCGRQSFDRTKTTYSYDRDAQGNWTRRTSLFFGAAGGKEVKRGGRITHREIAYFPQSGDGGGTIADQSANPFDLEKMPPCPPLVVRKSGGVLQGSAIKRVSPPYPRSARDSGISGSVVVEITTDERGKVVSVRTISGPQELRAAAEEAAGQWEFKPTLLTKIPVKVIGTITFNFNL